MNGNLRSFVEEADELVSSSRSLNIEYTGYKDTSTENPVNILGFRTNTERSKISKKMARITLLGVAREDLGCYLLSITVFFVFNKNY